jgi:hypothetical protein
MVIRCSFCDERFEEDRAQPTCRGCPLSNRCGLARCPRCGYENPVVPPWLNRLQSLMSSGRTRRKNEA